MMSNEISDARLAEMIAEQNRWLDECEETPSEYSSIMEAVVIAECAIYEIAGFSEPSCEGGRKLARIRQYLMAQAELSL